MFHSLLLVSGLVFGAVRDTPLQHCFPEASHIWPQAVYCFRGRCWPETSVRGDGSADFQWSLHFALTRAALEVSAGVVRSSSWACEGKGCRDLRRMCQNLCCDFVWELGFTRLRFRARASIAPSRLTSAGAIPQRRAVGWLEWLVGIRDSL